MADRILIDPDNRLLGSFSSDFALFGGQVDPVIAARFSEAGERQDEARESLPGAASGPPAQATEHDAPSAGTAPSPAAPGIASPAPAPNGGSSPPALDKAPTPATTAEPAPAGTLAASGPAAPVRQEPGAEAPSTNNEAADGAAEQAPAGPAAAGPGALHAPGPVEPIQGIDPAVVASDLATPESGPAALAALPVQPDPAVATGSADDLSDLVTTTLAGFTPGLSGLDAATAPEDLAPAALTALADPLASPLPAGAPLSELAPVQVAPLPAPAELVGAAMEIVAQASAPLPQAPVAEVASAAAAPAPPEAGDDLSDLGGSDPAGGIATLVGMVSSGQILDAPEVGEDAGAPSEPAADLLLDELTKPAADGEDTDTKIVTVPAPTSDDLDLPGGL